MDASLLKSKISKLIFSRPHSKCMHHNKIMSFTPLMSLRPSNHKLLEVTVLTDMPKITCYRDRWIDLVAINHLSHNLQAVAGIQIEKEGYDGLLEACRVVTEKFDLVQQRQLSLEGLKRTVPKQIYPWLKALLPNSKFTRELLAKFTGLFFVWLVGPSELKESELNGKREKNVVHVKKCRFLESSNCVGMCTNLCKFPTQTFIKDSLGMPVTMIPNFEDMSCDMVFGEEPPAPDVDPAAKQPCYKLCNHLSYQVDITLKCAPNMIPCYQSTTMPQARREPACKWLLIDHVGSKYGISTNTHQLYIEEDHDYNLDSNNGDGALRYCA